MGDFNFFLWFFYGDGIIKVTLFIVLLILCWPKLSWIFRRIKRITLKLGPVSAVTALHEEDARNAYYERRKTVCMAHQEIQKEYNKKVEDVYDQLRQLVTKIDTLGTGVDHMTLEVHKVKFYLDEVTDYESLISGLYCVAKGLNGDLKHDVEQFAREQLPSYKMAVALKPEWKLDAVEKDIAAGVFDLADQDYTKVGE